MTARPIDPEFHRMPVSATVALVLLLAMAAVVPLVSAADSTSASADTRDIVIRISQPRADEFILMGDIAQPEFFLDVQGLIRSRNGIRYVVVSNGVDTRECSISNDGTNSFSCKFLVYRNTTGVAVIVTDDKGNRATTTRNFTPYFGLPPPGIIYVNGVVLDDGGNPVPGALLSFENTTNGYRHVVNTTTDDDGTYSMTRASGFHQKITVQKEGLRTIVREESFEPYGHDINFTLSEIPKNASPHSYPFMRTRPYDDLFGLIGTILLTVAGIAGIFLVIWFVRKILCPRFYRLYTTGIHLSLHPIIFRNLFPAPHRIFSDMTARPRDPDGRRRPVSAAMALLLLLAMVMAAGCMEQAPDVQTVTITSATPTIPLTDRELAEQTIVHAREQIKNTDSIIAWFRGNASTKDDSQLPAIITKREIAMSYIVTAEDEIANGNFSQARSKATDAYTKANESYTDAMKRQGSIYSTSNSLCERSLPFDKTICILLTGLVPVLLTVLLYSVMQINPAAKDNPLGRFMGTKTVYILFIVMSLLFTVLVTGAKVAYIGALRQWMYLALVPWVCMMLGLFILSVIITGSEVFPRTWSTLSRKPRTADIERGTARSPAGKTWPVIRIIVTVLLILAMPLILYLGLLLAYPVLCI